MHGLENGIGAVPVPVGGVQQCRRGYHITTDDRTEAGARLFSELNKDLCADTAHSYDAV